MARLTTVLIVLLLALVLFPTISQNLTGQAQRSWKTTLVLCSDTDRNLDNNEYISGSVKYYSRARLYTYKDTCSSDYVFEGTCQDNILIKDKIYCPHGCDGTGATNYGACICEKDSECPSGYTCRYGTCGMYVKQH